MTPYSLRHSQKVFKHGMNLYRKKRRKLQPETLNEAELLLGNLEEALEKKAREEASQSAREFEAFAKTHFKKNAFDYTKEVVISLILALIIAIPVRQMWFELYEIPTGSMRPTFEEGDKLTVTKTTFGINTPLTASHLYFDPSIVERAGVVIIAGDNLDLPDTESTYFGIIPYTKRYIKRLVAKPGDSLYFYGGKLYSVDKEGKAVEGLRETPWMENLEYVPFLSFEGRLEPVKGEVLLKQMNQPLAKISLGERTLHGSLLVDGKWVEDRPQEAKEGKNKIATYSDFYGIGNFGMARLLTKKELSERYDLPQEGLGDGVLYLEVSHHPNLSSPPPRIDMDGYRATLTLTPSKSIIPLKQEHLDRLMESMYTARFVVYDSYAKRYNVDSDAFSRFNPRLSGVEDGTYEFYHGKGYSIGFGKVATALPSDHPLYKKTAGNIQKLYNFGINFDTNYASSAKSHNLMPSRYVYFRDGALYAMGKPLLEKDDPTLVSFVEKEKARAVNQNSYQPFIDSGPPLKEDGTLDIEKIQTFGVKVPEKHYLVLGDNHAMSADSRVFGFAPEENLRGTPSLILWPPGSRWGVPQQKPYPLITLPRLTVWAVALASAFVLYYYYKRRKRVSFRKKK